MRQVAHGSVYFYHKEDKDRILELMQFQSSAMHSAYQAINKYDLKNNDVKIYVKKNYMRYLNQRYIADACVVASAIQHKEVIFGGKRNWKKLQTKTITKNEWLERRNNQLYSRGDKSKKGNPNIRIVGNYIWINDPEDRGKWIKGKLYIPDKFKINLNCYDVRIIHKGSNKFIVNISYDTEIPDTIIWSKLNGVIGIDVNPDIIALSVTDKNGNMIHHRQFKLERISYASHNKRLYDIRQTAKEIVNYSLETGKPIVLENLQFNQNKGNKKGRKFRRMSHNFIYSKLLEAIERRALKCGIEVIKINPAFTSKLGILKFKDMYSLNTHISASLIIARRGMGIKERASFDINKNTKKDGWWNLEGRNQSLSISNKAYEYLKDLFLKQPSFTAIDLAVSKTYQKIGCG